MPADLTSNEVEPGRLDPGSGAPGEVSPTGAPGDATPTIGENRARATATRFVGLARVSTRQQADEGFSLEAQTGRLEAFCTLQGHQLLEVIPEAMTGKTTKRPGLERALGLIHAGEADGLVATKVDRVSRSMADFANLLAQAGREGWNLVILDLGLDLSTPHGRFAAHMMAAVAELEREMISQRTKDVLAAKKAQGVRLGRPSNVPKEVRRRIVRERGRGRSLQAIADGLTRDGVATAQGGKRWYASTVKGLLPPSDDQAAGSSRLVVAK